MGRIYKELSLKDVDCDTKWSINDFDIGKEIGSGQYAKVYVVREKRSKQGLIFALKAIKLERVKNYKSEENIKREIQIHRELHHQNIVKFHGFFWDVNKLYYILEFAGDCLYLKMYNNGKHCLKEKDAAKYTKQVTEALIYIHEQGFAHRDLKPENILISYDNNVKISDFGWAKQITDKDQDIVELDRSLAGTEAYLGPEMFRTGHYDSFKVDIWCLGVLIYEMVVGAEPFKAEDMVRDKLKFPCKADDDCKILISGLLQYEPHERMELRDVLKSKWLTRLNKTLL